MLELTGIASVLRGIGYLYWAVGIGLLGLAIWKGKGWKAKTLWALPVLCVFGYLPLTGYIEQQKREAYAKEAWAYFKNLCDTKSGEKIYKTFTGVKSVLIVKPLPPADDNDLKNQYWYGDPYSNATPSQYRHIGKASSLLGPSPVESSRLYGLDFVEYSESSNDKTLKLRRTRRLDGSRDDAVIEASQFESRVGISWEDISTSEDRKFWVAGSRLRIIDLTDNSVIAERIGYLIEAGLGSTAGQSLPWLTGRGPGTTCPSLNGADAEDRIFILKTLKSNEEK